MVWKGWLKAVATVILLLVIGGSIAIARSGESDPYFETSAGEQPIVSANPTNMIRQPCPQEPELRTDCIVMKRAAFKYQTDIMQTTIAALNGQQIASYVITILVAIVTVSGLVFSSVQLWKAAAITETSASIDHRGAKFRSSVLGVIVLILSLAFLVIYCREIYQLKPLRLSVSASEMPIYANPILTSSPTPATATPATQDPAAPGPSWGNSSSSSNSAAPAPLEPPPK